MKFRKYKKYKLFILLFAVITLFVFISPLSILYKSTPRFELTDYRYFSGTSTYLVSVVNNYYDRCLLSGNQDKSNDRS